MTENPFPVERSGDLREFGLPFEKGNVVNDAELEGPDPGSEEKPGTPPEEDTGATHTPMPSPEEGKEEGGEEAGDEYDNMLHRVRDQYQEPEPAEEDSDSALKQRLAMLEGQLRTYTPQPAPAAAPVPKPEPVAEEEGIDYTDPAVQAALAQAFSDPRTLGSTLKTLVNLEAKTLIKKEIGQLSTP